MRARAPRHFWSGSRQAKKASEGEGNALIGRFGVGFYSAFMVAARVEVFSRRAGGAEAWQWSSDGKGTFDILPLADVQAARRGTRVVLHLMDDAKQYAERATVEPLIKAQSGHVPVPIVIVDKPGAAPAEITDGAALWAKPKADISAADYTDFYRSIAVAFDEPALTIHFRAEGRQDYTALLFVPSSRPFDLFDPDRSGASSFTLNGSSSPTTPKSCRAICASCAGSSTRPTCRSTSRARKSRRARCSPRSGKARPAGYSPSSSGSPTRSRETFAKIWDMFGAVMKEGIYEDFERRDTLLKLARFKTTASADEWRSLKDYVAALKPNQTTIYYIAGDDIARLKASPHLEGFRARGVEVLLLPDPVDTFWVMSGLGFEGKPLKSVTQGAADLALIPRLSRGGSACPTSPAVKQIPAFLKETLSDWWLRCGRPTGSPTARCVWSRRIPGPTARWSRFAGAGRLPSASKPILEVNPQHELVTALAALGDAERDFKEDAAHLLFEEARLLDGERPADAKAFSDRLARVLGRGLRQPKHRAACDYSAGVRISAVTGAAWCHADAATVRSVASSLSAGSRSASRSGARTAPRRRR